jgi:tripartite-type tricarboxylate transporter receptor subunit TctC
VPGAEPGKRVTSAGAHTASAKARKKEKFTSLLHHISIQTYPTRPVRIIVGVAPGGGADITARLIGQWLSEHLGQQFLIENRPGGGTNIGTEAVVRAPADGYTLLLAGPAAAINATLFEKLTFNFFRDIVPVASIVRVPQVMQVNPSLPATTVPEFITYAKANPGKIAMGSGGNGSPAHVAGELFKMMTGVNMVHVRYRGGAPAVADLLGGQIQVTFTDMPTSIEYIRTGKLRALAVGTAMRSEALPDIPAVDEFLPGFEASQWFGLGAPKDTPFEIIGRLNTAINAAAAVKSTAVPALERQIGRYLHRVRLSSPVGRAATVNAGTV